MTGLWMLALLAALAGRHRHHRILSPGEAINALTIGATSEDQGPAWKPLSAGETDFSIPAGLPSPISAWGRGYRRIVKPELLAPGGRVAYAPTSPAACPCPRRWPSTTGSFRA